MRLPYFLKRKDKYPGGTDLCDFTSNNKKKMDGNDKSVAWS